MIEVSEDGLKANDCLVVTFAGLGQEETEPVPYEFRHSLSNLDCAGLHIRDTARRWYQYGPADGDSDPWRVVDRVRAAKAACGARRLVMLGNSMGGFGALLFASLMPETDVVLAFAPQTVIVVETAEREFGEWRWREYWETLGSPLPFGDLAQLPPPRADVSLIYDPDALLDPAHVERLVAAWPHCQKIAAEGEHDVAFRLRFSGALIPMISRAITGGRQEGTINDCCPQNAA